MRNTETDNIFSPQWNQKKQNHERENKNKNNYGIYYIRRTSTHHNKCSAKPKKIESRRIGAKKNVSGNKQNVIFMIPNN